MLIVLSFCISLASFAQEPKAILTSAEAPRLQGVWKSEAPEKMNASVYWTQEIQFTLGRWERTVFFSNTFDFKKVILIYRSEGPYELKNGTNPESSWRLDLKVARRALHPQQKHPALTRSLGIDTCAAGSRSEVDIKNGCGLFPAIEKCPVEYQAVESRDGKLRLGIVADPKGPPMAGACDEAVRPQRAVLTLKRVN